MTKKKGHTLNNSEKVTNNIKFQIKILNKII